jgi:L-aminopeptidase/D-esterase-like protein
LHRFARIFSRLVVGGIVSAMPRLNSGLLPVLCVLVAAAIQSPLSDAQAQAKPRARDLGVPFSGTPGPLNAITDVAGVEVGHATIVEGSGPLVVGRGPIRTGVTAIWPRGKTWQPVFAGWFAGNGFGEMTGAPWVVEGGVLGGPVMITGTYSVGVVRDAVNSWFHEVARRGIPWHQPVVGETSDAFLNDGQGQHVTKAHVFQALNAARTGPVPEGNVGGGTGMVAHGFKGGIGTASRRVGESTVGVMVQANYGTREQLTIAGVPVGREIAGADGSGDIFIAFSTANPGAAAESGVTPIAWLPNGDLTPLFQATVEATEEAIVNALVAAETMVGINGNTAPALPIDQLRDVLAKYNRLVR